MSRSLYSYLWSGLLEPGFERLKGKKLPQITQKVKRTQYLAWEQIQNLQWGELAALLRHAQDTVPFYRRFFSESGLKAADIIAKRDLSLLPVITRDMFTSRPDDFLSQKPPAGIYKKATGGSTGEPVRFWVCPDSDQWRNAMSRRGYCWAGVINGNKTLHLWGVDIYPKSGLKRKKEALHRCLLQRRYFSNFDLRPQRLDELMELIDQYQPNNLVCFTSSVEILARHAMQKGWKPKRPLESVVVGGGEAV